MRTLQSMRERYDAHRNKNHRNQLRMSTGKHNCEPYFSAPQFECKGMQTSLVLAYEALFSTGIEYV